MRLRAFAIAAVTVGTLAAALPAQAAGQFCYDVAVNANGEAVVAEADCVDLP